MLDNSQPGVRRTNPGLLKHVPSHRMQHVTTYFSLHDCTDFSYLMNGFSKNNKSIFDFSSFFVLIQEVQVRNPMVDRYHQRS